MYFDSKISIRVLILQVSNPKSNRAGTAPTGSSNGYGVAVFLVMVVTTAVFCLVLMAATPDRENKDYGTEMTAL